jgi:predicted ATPase
MISKVSIHNFKSLRDVQVDLERFTVLVGPNASGKSSILQALDLLCRKFLNPNFNIEPENLSRGSTSGFELAAESEGQAFRYCQKPLAPSALPATQGSWDGDGLGVATSLDASDWAPKPGALKVQPLPRSILLRLETSRLIQANPGSPDPAVMSSEGVGLHSALANMALHDPDSWRKLQDNLQQIIRTIRRLRFTKVSNTQQVAALLFDTVGADSLPASQVSEGTLLVLGMLTVLHTVGRPNLILLLDDLDRGLHPKAQKELIALLRGLLDTNPDLQIVATTHSPYMLDCMEVDEVRMTFLKDDGSTLCAPLTNHPNFSKWKDEMTPGEMWSLFGEKWIAEGVTA